MESHYFIIQNIVALLWNKYLEKENLLSLNWLCVHTCKKHIKTHTIKYIWQPDLLFSFLQR